MPGIHCRALLRFGMISSLVPTTHDDTRINISVVSKPSYMGLESEWSDCESDPDSMHCLLTTAFQTRPR